MGTNPVKTLKIPCPKASLYCYGSTNYPHLLNAPVAMDDTRPETWNDGSCMGVWYSCSECGAQTLLVLEVNPNVEYC